MRTKLILAAALIYVAAFAQAQPFPLGPGVQGVVVLAEHRFDPAVQRLIAKRELDALPLQDGKLYYVFPTYQSNAALEQLQIRYLEDMLSRRAAETEAELEEEARGTEDEGS